MKMTKRVLSVLLAVMMVLSCTVFASASFKDVDKDNDYKDAITFLSALNLVKGISADEFGVEQPVTRQQMALFIARAITNLKVDASPNSVNKTTFKDLYDATYNDAITHCFSLGIIKGRSETEFDPKGNVTVDEAITMAVRALGYVEENLKNEKLIYPGGFRQKAISLGLFKNLENVKFEANMLRGEVAQLIYNMLGAPIYRPADELYGYTPADTFYGLYYANSLIEAEGYIVATENVALETTLVPENDDHNQVKVVITETSNNDGYFTWEAGGQTIELPEGEIASDYDAFIGSKVTIYVKKADKREDYKVILFDAEEATIGENFFTGYKTASKLTDDISTADDVLSETYDGKGKLKDAGEYVKLNGKLEKSANIYFFTVNDGQIDNFVHNEMNLYYSNILNLSKEFKAMYGYDENDILVLERSLCYGTLSKYTPADEEKETEEQFDVDFGYNGGKNVEEDVKFADSLDIKSAEIKEGDHFAALYDGENFTVLEVLEAKDAYYLDGGKNGKAAKFKDGSVYYGFNSQYGYCYTETDDSKTPVLYKLYTYNNLILDVTTESNATSSPKAYSDLPEIKYLTVRNGNKAKDNSKTDANGIKTSACTYTAWAYVDGKLQNISITHIFTNVDQVNAIRAAKKVSTKEYNKAWDNSTAKLNAAKDTDAFEWSDGEISDEVENGGAIFAYEYNAEDNTYVLYTKDCVDENIAEDAVFDGAWKLDDYYYVNNFQYGYNFTDKDHEEGLALGDVYESCTPSGDNGKQIVYDDKTNTYKFEDTGNIVRFKFDETSTLVVGLATKSGDTVYTAYKAYNAESMPLFTSKNEYIYSINGIFSGVSALAGEDPYDSVLTVKYILVNEVPDDFDKAEFPVDTKYVPEESEYDFATLTMLSDKAPEKVLAANGDIMNQYVGLNLTTLKEELVLLPTELTNKSTVETAEDETVDGTSTFVIKKGDKWVDYSENIEFNYSIRAEKLAGSIYSVLPNNTTFELSAGGVAISADKDDKSVVKTFTSEGAVDAIGNKFTTFTAVRVYNEKGYDANKPEENLAYVVLYTANGVIALEEANEVGYNLFAD